MLAGISGSIVLLEFLKHYFSKSKQPELHNFLSESQVKLRNILKLRSRPKTTLVNITSIVKAFEHALFKQQCPQTGSFGLLL